MTARILGFGTAVPTHSATQVQAANAARRLFSDANQHGLAVAALYRRSGVQSRSSVLLEATSDGELPVQSFFSPAASPDDQGPTTFLRMRRYEAESTHLGTEASNRALIDATVAPGQIRHLVTVSCSGFHAPGFDIGLIQSMGLPANTSRTHVGFMGCHGALNGLRVAKALADSDPDARVLLCCVELCSLHFQYTDDPQQIVANSLFSDGAAAAVVGSDDRQKCWTISDQLSQIIPDTADRMSWRIGDHGFMMSLAPDVPAIIQSNIRPAMLNWLCRHDLSIEDIQSWAIHPGGPRILTATAEGLGIAANHVECSREILAEYGNMSSPTILFILDRLRKRQDSHPCVAIAFGPGLAIEAALLR